MTFGWVREAAKSAREVRYTGSPRAESRSGAVVSVVGAAHTQESRRDGSADVNKLRADCSSTRTVLLFVSRGGGGHLLPRRHISCPRSFLTLQAPYIPSALPYKYHLTEVKPHCPLTTANF